eukprot:9475392-Pyramimonas_sp.AAC.1
MNHRVIRHEQYRSLNREGHDCFPHRRASTAATKVSARSILREIFQNTYNKEVVRGLLPGGGGAWQATLENIPRPW